MKDGWNQQRKFTNPASLAGNKFFWRVVPESRSSCRNGNGASASQSSADGGGGGAARGELRLLVLSSLPQTHQQYLFEEIRKLCRDYLRNWRVRASEVTPEELLSEIWHKLLQTVPLHNDEASVFTLADPADWSINHAPELDGRVVWLIEEIGGPAALAHRYEDILRQRFGRSVPGLGRRIVQPGNERPFEIGSDPDEGSLQETDARHAWRGLLTMAALQFQCNDDVSRLLRLMTDVPDILEGSSGGQWPIKRMVALLNDRFPPPSWTGDRVDNAKRRLMNWIAGLRRKHGLDAIDLEGLFAGVARQRENGERVSPPTVHHPVLSS